MRILVVEDEVRLAQAVREALSFAGFTVDEAFDGEDGLRRALQIDYDAIVLDLMLPRLDGRTLLARLREERETPVLILTARDALIDKVGGLDAGADDYLTKPFELEELTARVRALVRRSAGVASPRIDIGTVSVDLASRTVRLDDEAVALSPKEFALLELLALNRGAVVTRARIYDHLWGDDDETWSNVVDVYVSNLRAKLGRDLITTRRGHGYLIEP